VWSRDGRRPASLDGNLPFVTSLAFDSAGRTIASGGGDGVVRLWDRNLLQLGRDLADHSSIIGGIAFRPGAERLVTAGGDGTIREWHIGPKALLADACSRLSKLSQYEVRWNRRVVGAPYCHATAR
jgi:WD40 repeat protein